MTADKMPIGIPSITISTTEPMASLMVFGRRSASSCVTGTFEIYEVPKSPFVSTLTIYLPYWTRTGSFQPISSRSSSTASFVAPSPRIKPLASPGVRFMIRKMIKEMPRSTGIMVNRRLPINFSMFFSYALSSVSLHVPKNCGTYFMQFPGLSGPDCYKKRAVTAQADKFNLRAPDSCTLRPSIWSVLRLCLFRTCRRFRRQVPRRGL